MWQYNYTNVDELYHHGIKGQKWGVRRYQNNDGTWTPEGKIRYGSEGSGGHDSKKIYKYEKKIVNGHSRMTRDIAKSKLYKSKEFKEAYEQVKGVEEEIEKCDAKLEKMHDDFYNNDALRTKYVSKEAEKFYKKQGYTEKDVPLSDYIDMWVNGDHDQQDAGFKQYIKDDRGRSDAYNKLKKEMKTLETKKEAAYRDAAKQILGDYYDKPVLQFKNNKGVIEAGNALVVDMKAYKVRVGTRGR